MHSRASNEVSCRNIHTQEICKIMNSPKKCLICGSVFIPKTYRHQFCARKCFLQYFKKSQKQGRFPIYVCPCCKKQVQLDFFPKMNQYKWEHFQCPLCGFGNDKIQDEEAKLIAIALIELDK